MDYILLQSNSPESMGKPQTAYNLAFDILRELDCNNFAIGAREVIDGGPNYEPSAYVEDENGNFVFEVKNRNATRFVMLNKLQPICNSDTGNQDGDGGSNQGDTGNDDNDSSGNGLFNVLPDICQYLPDQLQPICNNKLLWAILAGVTTKNTITKDKRSSKIFNGAIALYSFAQLTKKNSKTGRIGAIRKTSFVPVFENLEGDRAKFSQVVRDSQGKKGVYLIKENNKIVYVGYSGYNLYKTITRHFQQWNDSEQERRISYDTRKYRNKYTIRIVYAPKVKALNLERALILQYQPRDNKDKYEQQLSSDLDSYKEAFQEYRLSDFVDNPF